MPLLLITSGTTICGTLSETEDENVVGTEKGCGVDERDIVC